MAKLINVGIIGLDTSHSIQFAKRIQGPDCPPEERVEGMRAVACMRFETPFQDKKGLDERQKQLEEWGVRVTTDFNEAVRDCDVIMIEINDPAYHLEYFTKCAKLGKPMFLDKPLAENIKNGRAIYDMIKKQNLRVFSSSSLRFVPELLKACESVPSPLYVNVFCPLVQAPSGSSIIWYGVHAFEMLERAMGRGAKSVTTTEDSTGVVMLVEYPDKRHGVVELTNDAYQYGACLRDKDKAVSFVADVEKLCSDELAEIIKFFNGADAPSQIEDALEVMAMLDASECSHKSGKNVKIK